MREGTASIVRREDYAPPAWWIRSVELAFDLDPQKTLVANRMRVERNADVARAALRLHGEDLTLVRCLIDGQSVSFRHEGGCLVIEPPEAADAFTLEIRTTCSPATNTELSGLYTSGGGLFTQCEAEGFRRITYFLDRPDVMATYKVTLRADKAAYPVLLSNGNLVEQGELDNGRHVATWVDPFPKPSYLFALVAGNLVAREQVIRTRAGKEHLLQVWVRRGDLGKTEHAMRSLIHSVVWDEARFGLPLDLERFMIVAVGDFNMGAMENKGLNIFNTAVRAGRRRHGDRRRPRGDRDGRRPRVLPQLDRQPNHLPRLVPALPQGRPHRLPRPGVHDGPAAERLGAGGQADRGRARAAPVQFPEDAGRWRTRCGRTATSRSTTSTPPPIYEKGAEVVA
jgi:aminopeptidase N